MQEKNEANLLDTRVNYIKLCEQSKLDDNNASLTAAEYAYSRMRLIVRLQIRRVVD